MRNHTLMQTIARANRVYPGKQSGLIVDYANVFASLEKALAIYGKGAGGAMPVRDKKALADELRYAVNDANVYCLEHGVALAEIENMPTANFAQAGAIQAAADRLMAPETIKRDFLALEALVSSLYRAVKPDPVAVEFAQRCGCLAAIAACIRNVSEPPDISHIMCRALIPKTSTKPSAQPCLSMCIRVIRGKGEVFSRSQFVTRPHFFIPSFEFQDTKVECKQTSGSRLLTWR